MCNRALALPEDWKNRMIVPLHKIKSKKDVRSTEVCRVSWGRCMEEFLTIVRRIIGEEQCGFGTGRDYIG